MIINKDDLYFYEPIFCRCGSTENLLKHPTKPDICKNCLEKLKEKEEEAA